jgi:hypothetical protein
MKDEVIGSIPIIGSLKMRSFFAGSNDGAIPALPKAGRESVPRPNTSGGEYLSRGRSRSLAPKNHPLSTHLLTWG